MSDTSENRAALASVHHLSDAIRQVRNDLADREDVVVEMREAQRTRLELLAGELADIIAEVPDDHFGFDFAISSGAQPRFWIDPVAHVAMGRDRRTYRFVRDTRAGRVVMAESPDIRTVAESVTRYVAERIVERQRHLEGAEPLRKTDAGETQQAAPVAAAAATVKRSTAGEILSSFALYAMGLLSGGIVVLALLRDRVPELQTFF